MADINSQNKPNESGSESKQQIFSYTFTRVLAILLALLVVYSVVIIAKRQSVSGASEVLPSTTAAQRAGTVNVSSGGSSSDLSAADKVSVDDKAGNNGAQAADIKAKEQLLLNSDKAPSTPEEIVAYYKAANEKAKREASSITHLYSNATNYKGIVEAGALSSIGTWAMNTFMKEDSTETTYTSRDDIIANLPIGGESSCNLTADMVDPSQTKCTDNGNEYEIIITLNSTDENPDVNPPKGGGKAGTVGTVLTMQDITEPVNGKLTLEGIECRYGACKVTARVEKSTGNLTYLETDLPMVLVLGKAKAGPISVSDAKVGLEFEEHWGIEW